MGEDFQDSLRTEKHDERFLSVADLTVADVVLDVAYLGGGDIDSNGLTYELSADGEHLVVTVTDTTGQASDFTFDGTSGAA